MTGTRDQRDAISAPGATDEEYRPSTGRVLVPPSHRVYRVTPRQHETLYWLSFGLTVREVGGKLGVTENTARSLIRGLYRNLDVSNLAEATRVGFETGLLAPRVQRVGQVVGRPSVPLSGYVTPAS